MQSAIEMRTARGSRSRSGQGERSLHAVDLGLAGILFVLPFCMGGRQAWGQFALLALTTFVAAAFAARQAWLPAAAWRATAAQWLLLAAALLVSLQLMPLPEAWLARLSPEMPHLLPLWMDASGEARVGTWNQLSLAPDATREGLVQWLAYAALFLVAAQHVARTEHLERLLRWTAWSAAAMAAFGLVQYLATNGKFFWVYQHPFVATDDCVRGAFTNRNHFAHLLALGLGPLLWWVQSTWRSSQAGALRGGLAGLMLAIMLFAALMSFSRGGAVALAAAAAVYLAIAWRASRVSRQMILALGGLALLVLSLLLVHGYQRVAGRLDDLASGSLEQLDQSRGRRKIWAAVAGAIGNFPLLGTGVGSHAEIYHRYFDGPELTEYTHAESGYLQVAEETGLVGLALLLAGIGTIGYWLWRAASGERFAKHGEHLAAVAASLVASLVHSIYDFVWYVPCCSAVVALLAACAWRLARPEGKPARPPAMVPRWGWAAACAGLAAVGALAAIGRWGAIAAENEQHRYLIACRDIAGPRLRNELMLRSFSRIVMNDPRDARARLALAEACLRQFDLTQGQSENPLSLTAVRDAAMASRFANPAEMAAWLERALGPRRAWLDKALWHTRQALSLCPLQAQGYLYLAELSFLEGAGGDRAPQLIEQALAVRPRDGGVLFKAGEEAALAGNVPKAIQFWKQAFHSGPQVQIPLIDYLAQRRFPLSLFLEQFEPDQEALERLRERYRTIASRDEYRALVELLEQAYIARASTSQGTVAAELWLQAHGLAAEASEHEAAERYLRQALAADAANFHVHWTAAQYLLKQERAAEAVQHFKWCLDRKPDDKQLRDALEAATKARINAQTQTAAVRPRSIEVR